MPGSLREAGCALAQVLDVRVLLMAEKRVETTFLNHMSHQLPQRGELSLAISSHPTLGS